MTIHPPDAPKLTPQPGPGQVVWVQIFNPFENPGATGKWRPGILVRRCAGHWTVIGLTTNRRYRNGRDRTAIPQPRAIGLPGPGFIWGDRLTQVSAIDIGDHLGFIDEPTAEVLITVVNLDEQDAAILRQAARHPSRNPSAA
jgi:hypothetical protein